MQGLNIKSQTRFSQDKANNLYQQGLLLANNTVDKWIESAFNDTAEFSIVIVGSLAGNIPPPACMRTPMQACFLMHGSPDIPPLSSPPPTHSDA